MASIEDHSLDQRSIFRADAFATALVAVKPARTHAEAPHTRVSMMRRRAPALHYGVEPRELPLFPGDDASPWLLAPPDARAALRRMQRAGPPLGHHDGLRVHRGVVTGCNDALVVARADAKLAGLARILAEGHARAGSAYAAWIESDPLRPCLRGRDIRAWRAAAARQLIWCHDDETGAPVHPGPRLARYLARHRDALRARTGWREGLPLGAVFRVGPWVARAKVAWRDLARDLEAVALPARSRCVGGRAGVLVPLNTVFCIPLATDDDALLLAALLNSAPLRTFARAVAERAKDAHFRFQAWTISCLPLPANWREAARPLRALSVAAHARGGIEPREQSELDACVARLYRLRSGDVEALADFARWLDAAAGRADAATID